VAAIQIRPYERQDINAILQICCKTGYMGQNLAKIHFKDRLLFAYLFCLYYPLYEPEHCFVAVTEDDSRVVGYIIGTPATLQQIDNFIKTMIWRIFLRILTITLWRYPQSFLRLGGFLKTVIQNDIPDKVLKKYPAHFHINVDPDFQASGIGTQLLTTFEEHIRRLNVSGIHLETTTKNKKAIPFYKKHNYKILKEFNTSLWDSVEKSRTLLLVKQLNID